MKKLIQFKLKYLTKLILAKYKPEIIGITGSVGKTSAKEAIKKVLGSKYNVRASSKNYNNEFGLPLSIIGLDSPGKSALGWIQVLWKALMLVILRDKNYPNILILEMGVDRPGDMKYLTSIAKPSIGVVTQIGTSHIEYFGSLEKIQAEKEGLIKNLKKGGWAILNFDDELVKSMSKKSKVKVMTYGFKKGAKVRAQKLKFSFEESKEIDNMLGLSFKLSYDDSMAPVLLEKVIGYPAIYAALAAASVGIIHEMNLADISKALREYKAPRGRMNLINGIKGTLVIDDTYNSAPQSVISALNLVSKIKIKKGAKKYAVLGDMLELGNISEQSHQEIGEYLVKSGIDILLTVGERARDIGAGAKMAGMSRDYIFNFDKSEEAGSFLEDRIKDDDLILVKGSQGVRMEKIVKEIMAEPLRAEELLVRQGEGW